ncbi:SusC/RagA family TonB-linked outer membrane protein [Chitinophaga sp. 212800010-3]|uniref:SusC/RagA family TonB-linked outer membrane protein n=1 Tax=unclassified Chitinophaga TaxID=2619133 RepID=UPI002DE4BFBB|nr:SusC/RagA family TonB-linked outer membrane protein [Chitinophaga sp. 212800010-3]
MVSFIKSAVVLLSLSVFITFPVFAQQRVLTGTVTDSTGAPVPGATIREKGGKGATTCGPDGNFRLSADAQHALIISNIGYQSVEVPIGTRSNFSIVLSGNTSALNTVVVTALGVRREKRNLTFSSQQLNGAELVKTKEPNIVNTLAGKVPGLQITSSSGNAGASSRIVIRGNSSPTGENQALFVIDGVPVDNSETGNISGGAAGSGVNRLADIDPSIIESVNILKGAAATALYGSSGARGVVLITTKNGGGDKKPVLNFSSDYSFEHPLLPERQTIYGQGTNGTFYNGENKKTSLSWGPRMDTLRLNGKPAPVYDPYSFFRTGITTNNSISASGSNNGSNYFVSYTYFDQKGVMPGNDFKRHSVFAKYNSRMGKYVNTTFQLGYSNSVQDRLPEGASNGPLFVLLLQPVSWNPYPVLQPDGTQRGYRYSRNMPLWDLDNISNKSKVNRFMPVITTNITPTSWLTITERLGADIYTESDKYVENPSPQIGLTGQIRNQNVNFQQFNNDLIINAAKTFGRFNVNLLVGNNIYSTYNQYMNINGTGLTITDFNNLSSGSTITGTEAYYEQRKVGFYSQANIEYNRFLNLSLTGRYDGSSVLNPDKNFYPYGSAATSFIFSEFLGPRASKAISFGKVRFSYATVGNDGVGPYSLSTPYVLAGRNTNAGYFQFPFQGQPGFLLTSALGNPGLINERLNEYEAGLEMRFLHDRISFEGSYFSRRSKNGLIPGILLSNATGFSNTTFNSAEISNKGVELLLSATPVKSKDFSWNVMLNFSKIKNKVLTLAPGIDQLGRLITGQPYNIFYGNRYKRTDKGELLIDANGLPVVDPQQGIIGDVNPDWLAGMENNFRYKQFSLSFFFDMKKGGDVQNDVEGAGFYYGTAKVTANRGKMVIKGISEADGKENTVAVDAQTYYQTRQIESTIQDGTYIKLRNVSLSYAFPASLTSHTPFRNASFTVTGRNLWIYSPHFTGADPEVSSYGTGNGVQGVYAFSTPTARSVNFSLKFSF